MLELANVLVALLAGSVAGSMLNAVISCIPRSFEPDDSLPRRACDHPFGHLTPGKTIPLLSYLVHRRSCAICRRPIQGRYLTVELGTALVTAIIVLVGDSITEVLVTLGYAYGAITLASIDVEERLLPQEVTVPLLGAALLFPQISLSSAVHGMILGFAFMWAIRFGFKKLRKKEALHLGDVQLTGVIGAWIGVEYLFLGLGLATLGAGGMVLMKSLREKGIPSLSTELPFGGPLLAAGGVVVIGVI